MHVISMTDEENLSRFPQWHDVSVIIGSPTWNERVWTFNLRHVQLVPIGDGREWRFSVF